MSFNFFKNGPRPVLIAHRGASGYAPENTLAAFKLALDMGARFLEMDVHQTKEGIPVVIHDEDLARVAGARKRVNDMTMDEILKFSAGAKFDKNFAAEKVPTLEETLTLISRRAVVNVEIKGDGYPGLEEKVVSLLERKGYNGMSFVSSSDADILRRTRAANSIIPLGYIMGSADLRKAMSLTREINCQALVCSAKQANKTLIQKAHQRALHVCVYTINNKREWDRLAKLRADALFTDFPDLMGVPEFEQTSIGLTAGEE